MKHSSRWFVLTFSSLLSAGLTAACGGSSSSTSSGSTSTAGSCTYSGFCIDYTGSAATASTIQASCTSGTYSASACPTASRIGSCKVNSGASNEYIYRYFSPSTSVTATSACSTQSGTYTAG